MDTAVADLLELLAIPGISAQEGRVADHVERVLRQLGVPAEAVVRDQASASSEYGGETGNLMVRLGRQGNASGPGRLFCAHLDTVAIAKGCKPRLIDADGQRGARIVNDQPGTALGADDRTGCAILLQIARALTGPLATRPRPPVTLLFTVQEELGLVGARGLNVQALGLEPGAIGFNFDGGPSNQLVTRVTGTWRFILEIRGIAAHAGSNPQEGVSAAVAAAKAIAELAAGGWHGRIDRPEGAGSSNVGVIQGGTATNVVMDRVTVFAEARSHDAAFRNMIMQVYKEAFERAAAQTRSRQGAPATVTLQRGPCYESFALADDAPVVQAALAAARRCGLDPRLVSNDGGMDANWLHAHGIATVTFGAGQHDVHSPQEWIDVDDFLAACRVGVDLARSRDENG